MSYKSEYQEDEQFVRRAFDAIYDFSPEGVADFFKRIPRKVIWMAVSVIASLVLIIIAWQFAVAGVDAYQWSQRTPLRERMIAPYSLDQRQLPVIDLSTVMLAELPKVNSAALEADRAAAVALAGEQWLSEAQQAYEAALASGEVITPETAAALTAAAQAEAIAAAE